MGWTENLEPVALAQKATLTKGAFLVHPDGPGSYEFYLLGEFVILKGKRRIPVDLKIPGAREISVVDAALRTDSGGFLLIVSVDLPTKDDPLAGEIRCFIVDPEGISSECAMPEDYELQDWGLYLPPGGHEVLFRRVSDRRTRFEKLDVDTGAVEPLDAEFMTFGLRSHTERTAKRTPCSVYYAQISPNEDEWAFVCWMPGLDRRDIGLWLLDKEDAVRLAFAKNRQEMIPHRVSDSERLEDMVTSYREEYSLAWSPDQHRLYWCGDRLGTGVVVSLTGDEAIEHRPCVLQAAWSPDGVKIVGVKNSRLLVCDVPDRAGTPEERHRSNGDRETQTDLVCRRM